MRSTLVALGSAALLGLTSSQFTDTFVLSQCECPELEFSPLADHFFFSAFKLATNAQDVLQCSGHDDFPVAPGFTAVFTNETESTGLSANASGKFFFEGGSRSEWYVAMRLLLKPADGASIRLLGMTSEKQNLLTVDLSTTTKSANETEWKIQVASEIGAVNFSGSSTFATEPTLFDIIIGEGTVNDKFGVFAYIVTGGTSDASTTTLSSDLPDFITLLERNVLSVEMFSGSTDGEPFAVQVNGFEFGRGKFPGFPVTGFTNKNDVFDALGFAPVAALPSVSQSQQRSISGVQDESLDVDVTRFLVGGDIALEDLEIIIQTGDLIGTFATSPFDNPFTYTPSKKAVGNQTFSFTYGVTRPYSCFNQNVPVTMVITKDSNASAGTILLTVSLTAIVLAGIIGAATVSQKKMAAKDDEPDASINKKLNQNDEKTLEV